ncbi:hypothetical protein SAMN02910289_00709 [Lachnospiraceae bacterium RM5]|nr:hypothetical protein SAMN02910289_00709 [Lachnospiraceae bacterium RM5]
MLLENIDNIKNFTTHLFSKNTFDYCMVNEVKISTYSTFTIDGHLNYDYFSDEEKNDINNEHLVSWSKLRPICFDLIKGKKLPISFSIIFAMKRSFLNKLINENNIDIDPEDINDLFMNIKYKDDKLTLTTGVSLKIFTLDKSLENAFDKYISNFISTLS